MKCDSTWLDTIQCIYEPGHNGASVPHAGLLPAVNKRYEHETGVTWESVDGPLSPMP
jgi:hypothetical protein